MKSFTYILFVGIIADLVQSKSINITLEADDLLRIMDKFYSLTGSQPHTHLNVGRSGGNHRDENPFHPEDKMVETSLNEFNKKYRLVNESKKKPLDQERKNYEKVNKRLEKENQHSMKNNYQDEAGRFIHRKGFKRAKKSDVMSHERTVESIESEYAKEFIDPDTFAKSKLNKDLQTISRRGPEEEPVIYPNVETKMIPRIPRKLHLTEQAVNKRREKLLTQIEKRHEVINSGLVRGGGVLKDPHRRRKVPSRLLSRRYLSDSSSDETIDTQREIERHAAKVKHLEPRLDLIEKMNKDQINEEKSTNIPLHQHNKDFKILEETFESKTKG